MAIIVVQNQMKSVVIATSATYAYGSNVTAGNTLICFAGTSSASATLTVSDGLNGSWGSALVNSTSHFNCGIFALNNTLGGACTVTVGVTGSIQTGIALFEVSGLNLPTSVDKTVANHSSAGTTSLSVGPTTTTSVPNEFTLAGFCIGSVQTFTNTGAGTLLLPATGNIESCTMYNTISSVGTPSATATLGGAANYDAVIATFASTSQVPPGAWTIYGLPALLAQ